MIQPYLFFNGRCTEAIEFYRRSLGAELSMKMLAKESPVPMQPENPQPGWEDRVIHVELRIAGGTLMLSDGCGDTPAFEGFSLSLCLPTREDAHKAFNALADGVWPRRCSRRIVFLQWRCQPESSSRQRGGNEHCRRHSRFPRTVAFCGAFAQKT